MREISAQIAKSSEESGEKLSGGDVENTAEIINTIISSTEEELSEETLENLITTIHNVHEYTIQEEVRREGACNKLRESAVAIAGELANTPNTFKSRTSVGRFKTRDIFRSSNTSSIIFDTKLTKYYSKMTCTEINAPPFLPRYFLLPLFHVITYLPAFGVAEIVNSSVSEKKHQLVLAGEMNTISGCTNEIGEKLTRFFSVSNDRNA